MSRKQLDAIALSFSSADTEKLLAHLGTLLPEKKSWSSQLRIWGDEETDDIQVGLDGPIVEDVQFRLNVGDLSLPLVGSICAFARRFDCLLATRDGAIIPPKREAVVRAIAKSRAAQFVRDPQGFLEEAIRLDKGER